MLNPHTDTIRYFPQNTKVTQDGLGYWGRITGRDNGNTDPASYMVEVEWHKWQYENFKQFEYASSLDVVGLPLEQLVGRANEVRIGKIVETPISFNPQTTNARVAVEWVGLKSERTYENPANLEIFDADDADRLMCLVKYETYKKLIAEQDGDQWKWLTVNEWPTLRTKTLLADAIKDSHPRDVATIIFKTQDVITDVLGTLDVERQITQLVKQAIKQAAPTKPLTDDHLPVREAEVLTLVDLLVNERNSLREQLDLAVKQLTEDRQSHIQYFHEAVDAINKLQRENTRQKNANRQLWGMITALKHDIATMRADVTLAQAVRLVYSGTRSAKQYARAAYQAARILGIPSL